VKFSRITNFEVVREVLTYPTIYPLIGDDYAPPVEEFQVNEHPEIYYLIVLNADLQKVGMFSLFPANRICWDTHVVMLPVAKAGERWAAARQLVPWLRDHTHCMYLTAAVPACHQQAIVYGTHGIGMRYVGRHPKAFMKWGKLHDLILLGRPVNDE
jgi:hypothetical protein